MNLIQRNISLFFLFYILPFRLQGQDFIPYAEFDSTTGNYIISYERDPQTGFIYKTLLVPRVKILPNFNAAVVKDDLGYNFIYNISNQSSAVQSIFSFDLQRENDLQLISPSNWSYSLYQYEPYGLFLYSGDNGGIAPGDTTPFVIRSRGLPHISSARVRGKEDTTSFQYVVEPSLAVYRLIDSLRSIPENRYVLVATLSPNFPPTPFHALTFLDTITSYITESRTLGWITNDPTANKYKRLIDTARFHLQANNRGVTKAKLDSVLVNVYPDSAAGLITSEAYALLRFNTEYLLMKLSEE
jgi:hypothetical protein